MLNRVLEYQLFSSGSFALDVGQLLSLIVIALATALLWKLTQAKWRLDFFQRNDVDPPNRRRFERHLRQIVFLISILLVIRILKLDFELFNTAGEGDEGGIIVRYSILIIALLILVGAWLLEWFFSNILIHKYEKDRQDDAELEKAESQQKVRNKITRLVQYSVLALAAMAIISKFGWNFSIFSYTVDKADVAFRPNKILAIILIFLLAQIINWVLIQVALYSIFKTKGVDQGSRFAINQLIKYVIYTIAIFLALKSLSIDMTLILGGAAALLVGIGLGLQQTFNDFFSGLVLLFERSVSVGDIMEVGGEVGVVKKIGLRSSIIETRGHLSVIVPNSQLVNDSVKNWSHFVESGRFQVDVGVAYGSDTAKVKRILLTAVTAHTQVVDFPPPFVRFQQFADSSLNFSVYFFTSRFIVVEDIKSDLRFEIDRMFREENVEIPFPQRDVWMKSSE